MLTIEEDSMHAINIFPCKYLAEGVRGTNGSAGVARREKDGKWYFVQKIWETL
jgi:hypothetical protein